MEGEDFYSQRLTTKNTTNRSTTRANTRSSANSTNGMGLSALLSSQPWAGAARMWDDRPGTRSGNPVMLLGGRIGTGPGWQIGLPTLAVVRMPCTVYFH